jgi:NRAMP (natural resistance-associated macrophage protein)-like metal ion transporter
MKSRIAGLSRRFWIFLAIMGPATITANVDNDAGGITTYSVAGATYGYHLLWTIIPMTLALIVVQEICLRMGVVTGKGLADLIRERTGVRWAAFIMLGMFLGDLGNTICEFAGIAASMELFGVSKYISVPLGALFIWIMVLRGSYKVTEKIFLGACVIYLGYVVSGFMAHPPWGEVARDLFIPSFSFSADYIIILVGVIGTTIAPWQQFYIQAAVVEKGITVKDYGYSKWDNIFGCTMCDVVALFIIVACAATIHAHGIKIESAKEAALALGPLAGKWAFILFALGLLNASLFSATILPLSTAYFICEAFGFEGGIDHSWNEAPVFYWLYTLLIIIGAAVILIPNMPLILVMLWSQVINGVLLPFILIIMLILVNNKDLMGAYVNSWTFNIISWVTVVIMIVLTLLMVVTSFLQ